MGLIHDTIQSHLQSNDISTLGSLLDIRRFADEICVSDWLSTVKIRILVHMASTRRALGVKLVFDPRTWYRRSYRDAIFAA